MARVTKGIGRRAACWLGALAVGVALVPGLEGAARADETQSAPSSASGKGIVGGALLGGEVVMGVEAIIGVKRPLAYAIGGILGAGAGGVGGYFVEHNASDSRPSLYLLAGGMALIIPTTVAVLSASAYQPPPEYQEDSNARGAEPSADAPRTSPIDTSTPGGGVPAASPPGPPPGSTPTTAPPGMSPAPSPATGPGGRLIRPARERVARAAPPATSVFDVYTGSVRLGVPAVEVRPTYSAAEMRQFGVTQHEEVRIPVLHAVF